MSVTRASDMNLTDADVVRCAGAFGIESLKSIGGFENALFMSTDPGGRVLRLTHTSRRSVGMIEAEFAFMDHLSRDGVPVVAPVPSVDGRLVEEVTTDDGEGLVVVCMTEAPGSWRDRDGWADSEIGAYGALLGAMHVSGASFIDNGPRRPSWTGPHFRCWDRGPR